MSGQTQNASNPLGPQRLVPLVVPPGVAPSQALLRPNAGMPFAPYSLIPSIQTYGHIQLHPFATGVMPQAAGHHYGQLLPGAAVDYQYSQGLMAGLERIRNSHSKSWQQKVHRVEKAFQSWLNSMGLSWQQATPWDIIVFLESAWVQQHARSTLADGSKWAAPSSVQGELPGYARPRCRPCHLLQLRPHPTFPCRHHQCSTQDLPGGPPPWPALE